MRESDVNRLVADISQARQVVKDLDPNAYPAELSHIVMYLKRLQSFWLWQAEQGLASWQNGEKPELQWDDIDTRESCANTIAPLGAPQDNEQACRIVFFNWHNCVNTKVQNQLGRPGRRNALREQIGRCRPRPRCLWRNHRVQIPSSRSRVSSAANTSGCVSRSSTIPIKTKPISGKTKPATDLHGFHGPDEEFWK